MRYLPLLILLIGCYSQPPAPGHPVDAIEYPIAGGIRLGDSADPLSISDLSLTEVYNKADTFFTFNVPADISGISSAYVVVYEGLVETVFLNFSDEGPMTSRDIPSSSDYAVYIDSLEARLGIEDSLYSDGRMKTWEGNFTRIVANGHRVMVGHYSDSNVTDTLEYGATSIGHRFDMGLTFAELESRKLMERSDNRYAEKGYLLLDDDDRVCWALFGSDLVCERASISLDDEEENIEYVYVDLPHPVEVGEDQHKKIV